MNLFRFDKVPAWKQLIALLIVLYLFLSLFLPTVIALFFNTLPYVHNISFQYRFVISACSLILITIVLYALDPRQFVNSSIRNWFKSIAGILLFSYAMATFNANLMGLLTKISPGVKFQEQVTIVKTSFYKSHSVSLELKEEKTKKSLYLVLSSRLFYYPRFKNGDILILHGKKNIFGSYIMSYEAG